MARMTNFRSAAIATGNQINDSAYDNVKIVADNIGNVNTVGTAIDAGAFDVVIDNVADVVAVASNIADVVTTAGIEVEIQSVAADKITLDSIYADKATLDSLFADKATLDSIFTDKATLDSLYADKAELDAIYTKLAVIQNVNDNMTDINNASDNANTAKLQAWEAEAFKMTSESYATEDENVFVKIYTSNSDGTFSYTDSTNYSSYHWKQKSALAALGSADNISYDNSGNDMTSTNVQDAISELEVGNVSQQSSIDGLIDSVLALSTSNAQGQFSDNSVYAVTTSEQAMPFTPVAQSTDTTKLEIGTNVCTIKEAGTYSFLSTMSFEDTGANGATATISFNLRDVIDNTLYYTQATSIEISDFGRKTIPFNSLMTVPDTLTFPITIDINIVSDTTGYSVVGLNSIITQQGGSIQTLATIDNGLGNLITGVLV